MGKRLIDLNEAVRMLCCEVVAKYPASFASGIHAAARELERMASIIDAVEVVRCRSCTNFDRNQCGVSFCRYWDADSYEDAFVHGDDYCSRGKRRGKEGG